eukprot:2429085-Prymnesium_polylepis.1
MAVVVVRGAWWWCVVVGWLVGGGWWWWWVRRGGCEVGAKHAPLYVIGNGRPAPKARGGRRLRVRTRCANLFAARNPPPPTSRTIPY